MAQNSSSPSTGSNPLLIVVYWAIVAVPLGWGVYKTVQKSLPLFNATAPAAAASPTPQPVATPAASPVATAEPTATVAPTVTPTT